MARTSRKRELRRAKGPLYPTFIRQWRRKKGLTLIQLAERIGITHGHLSKVERGVEPYDQEMLELIAIELGTDPPSLLMRDPSDPDGIWSVWDQAKNGQRRQIVEIAKTVLRTGTE